MILNFMGPPGAGKGTQAKLVEDRLHLVQVSTGDILRSAVRDKTEMGLKANEYMNRGELVSDEVVIGIIRDRIKQEDCQGGFILDGFPRTAEQAEALDKIFSQESLAMDMVINFEVESEELIKRLLSRAEQEGRADDNLETIKNRLEVFQQKTQPVLDYYEKKGILKNIQGRGSVEEIENAVKKTIGK